MIDKIGPAAMDLRDKMDFSLRRKIPAGKVYLGDYLPAMRTVNGGGTRFTLIKEKTLLVDGRGPAGIVLERGLKIDIGIISRGRKDRQMAVIFEGRVAQIKNTSPRWASLKIGDELVYHEYDNTMRKEWCFSLPLKIYISNDFLNSKSPIDAIFLTSAMQHPIVI